MITGRCLIFLGLFGIDYRSHVAKADGEFHVREFARLPVLLGGRIQPFDSMARNLCCRFTALAMLR